MNSQELNIDGLDDIYRKTCSLADQISDKDESKQDADLRLALMFFKYAKTHNLGGKFDHVYDEDTLIAECERYLIHVGNSAYFDYRLTAYRNNMDLLNMLRNALKLLINHEPEIAFRRNNPTFLDKIFDGHIAEVERLEKESAQLIVELDARQTKLSKFGFVSKHTIRKNDYTLLEKDVKELCERKDQLAADIAAVEDEYRPYHADYKTYMQNLSCENADKISRYFFCEHNEEFEQIYGMSNMFEADRGWLNEKIEWIIDIIGANKDTQQQLQNMLEEARRYIHS